MTLTPAQIRALAWLPADGTRPSRGAETDGDRRARPSALLAGGFNPDATQLKGILMDFEDWLAPGFDDKWIDFVEAAERRDFRHRVLGLALAAIICGPDFLETLAEGL